MRKILGRMLFMLTFFWLGTAYGLAAHGESVDEPIDPAPRAIQCSAAFELMSRAATQWSQQADVIDARLAWADYVNAISTQNGADAGEQVANEMRLLADTLVDDPSGLAALAVRCVADAPPMPATG